MIAPRTGRLVQQPTPPPGAGQVVVRVLANGVCASELPVWANGGHGQRVSLGHEPVGEIAAVGPGVDLEVGVRVTGRIQSSFADLVVADVADLVVVPDAVDTEHALGEPLGCVAEALRRTPVRVGDRVAVVGLGFMGLCMLQLVTWSPGAQLVAVDLRDDARRLAADLGADATGHPDELGEWGAAGFDVVVEATGAQGGLDVATSLVRPHGVLAILGYHQGQRHVDVETWNYKAIDVINAHVRDRTLLRDGIRRGLAMVAAGRVHMAPLLTHRFDLTELDTAFATAQERPDGFVKALVTTAGS